jgi:ABC-type branched-subunit amino acid transport system substrate-binding protein
MAGAQVAQARRVPFIAPATGATALRDKDKDMVFNIRASFKDEVTRIATHLQTTGVKRVSFFSLLIPESKIMFEHLGEHLGRSGLKYFSVANVTPDAIDIPKAARELKPAETHAVVMFCPGKMCADLAREVRQQGGMHVTFYTISSAGDVFGPLAEQGASIAVSQVMPYPWIPGQFSVVNQYQKAMSQAGKTDYGYWSLEGYVSARVLVEGLRRMSGSPSPQALATAMRSLGTLDIGNLEITPGAAPSNSRGAFTEITLARAGGRYRR